MYGAPPAAWPMSSTARMAGWFRASAARPSCSSRRIRSGSAGSFDGNVAPEPRIPAPIDATHAALANERNDFVRTEAFARDHVVRRRTNHLRAWPPALAGSGPRDSDFRLTSLRQGYGGPPKRFARRRKAEATQQILKPVLECARAARYSFPLLLHCRNVRVRDCARQGVTRRPISPERRRGGDRHHPGRADQVDRVRESGRACKRGSPAAVGASDGVRRWPAYGSADYL
jgi:hypothetical protein